MTDFREHILSTRPDSPFPLVNDEGDLTGPFSQMERLGKVGFALANLGESLRYSNSLSNTQREAVILWVGFARNCEFELWAHRRVARAQQCLTGEDIEALSTGRLTDVGDAEAQKAASLADRILAGRVSEKDLTVPTEGTEDSERSDILLQFVVLTRYYDLLAQMMNLEAIGIPR